MKFVYFLFALLIDMIVSVQEFYVDELFKTMSGEKGSFYVKETDVLYYLYTPMKHNKAANLWTDLTNFNSEYPVKILIHGFTEGADVDWYKNMRLEYLKRDNYNIIEIDWSYKARNTSYFDAVIATFHVGSNVGDFLIKLFKTKGLNFGNVHIIGHSLGAHIGSFVANRIFSKTKMKIFRISGLDPAGPLFEIKGNNANNWLDASDATFVDIIHTDGGLLGYKNSTGTVDFFPNGGSFIQPGCEIVNFIDIVEYICSHRRSHDYFTETINNKAYATKCSSWDAFKYGACDENSKILFGDQADPKSSGNFYLYTNPKSPFLKE